MAANLQKHARYKAAYDPSGGLFWGIGIEEETYLQTCRPIQVATPIIRLCQAPERYSVDYAGTYDPLLLAMSLADHFPDKVGFVPLPYYLNSHALTAMDTAGQHRTTYAKVPKPNPDFSGKTIFEELQAHDPTIFKDGHEVIFTFDGDSIEFMTQRFYCAKVPGVVAELVEAKANFLKSLNRFVKARGLFKLYGGALTFARGNPGFVIQTTNPSQVAMFNNGTYHFNITLPSYTDPVGSAALPAGSAALPALRHPAAFVADHRRFIRLIQWLEPFVLAMYGSPDPFGLTKASQRCAISRYIGIGTYDTSTMPEGKLLSQSTTRIRGSEKPFWWYRRFHENSGYIPLKAIGMDINFRKHHNHGVEIRCLDWFPHERLASLLRFFILLADLALSRPLAPEAALSETWNDVVVGVLKEGKSWPVSASIAATYERILGIPITPGTAATLFNTVQDALEHVTGQCSRLML